MKKINIVLLFLFIFGVSSCGADDFTASEATANYLASLGIIEDHSQNPEKYLFDSPISRREMLKIMINISGNSVPPNCTREYFSDIPSSDWACKYSQVAVENGYITSSNKYYRPDERVSQIEALKMLMQSSNIQRDENTDWRAGYVSKAYTMGILPEKYLEYDTDSIRYWIFSTAQKVLEASVSGYSALNIGISTHTIQVGDDTRYYKIYAPKADMKGRPILMFLHGGRGSMDVIDGPFGQSLQALSDQEDILLLIPNATNTNTRAFDSTSANWNDGRDPNGKYDIRYDVDDVFFLNTLLGNTIKTYDVSDKNIFVFGHSNGGNMTQRLLLDNARYISAAGVLSSNVMEINKDKEISKQVPLLLWLGSDDPLMLYNPTDEDEFLSLGGPESAQWWAEKNKTTNSQESVTISQSDKNGCYTTLKKYEGENPVYFYTSVGGGHTIPSIDYIAEMGPLQARMSGPQCNDINAAPTIWNFFSLFIK